jgi:hypothetical protein
MGRRLPLAINLALASILAWTLLGQPAATPAPAVRYQSYAAPAFTSVQYSTHNDGSKVCGQGANTAITDQQGENKGDLDNGNGSYLHAVNLPQGVTVESLSLWTNDFSADDVYLFLIRKKLDRGMNSFAGYLVMARTKSQGAVQNTMRRFTDTSIQGARIDNQNFYYYLELIECDTEEPHAAQIGFEP